MPTLSNIVGPNTIGAIERDAQDRELRRRTINNQERRLDASLGLQALGQDRAERQFQFDRKKFNTQQQVQIDEQNNRVGMAALLAVKSQTDQGADFDTALGRVTDTLGDAFIGDGMDNFNQIIPLAQQDLSGTISAIATQAGFDNPIQAPTTKQRDAAFVAPGDIATQREIVGRSNSGVTVNLGGDTPELEKQRAKLGAQRLSKIAEDSAAAIDTLQSLDTLDAIDVKTGAGEDWKLGFRQFGESINNIFGADLPIDEQAITNAEAFNAASGKMLLNVMSTQKGPQTDQDRAFIATTLPRLGNTEDARRFITNGLRANAFRKLEKEEFINRYLDENEGARVSKAEREWRSFLRETPMVAPPGTLIDDVNPNMPIYYFQFRDSVKSRQPNVSDTAILAKWREETERK